MLVHNIDSVSAAYYCCLIQLKDACINDNSLYTFQHT